MFGKKKTATKQVKTFSAFTKRGLDKQINKFAKKHNIIDIDYSSSTETSNESAMVTYEN
jgi:hypothetical protein